MFVVLVAAFRRLSLVLAFLLVVGFVLHPTIAGAAPHAQPAAAQTPLPVRDGSAKVLRPEDPSQTIRLAIGLVPPHMAAEQQFLRELQDKSSPLFHQFLTRAQWTTRFGPTPAAQQAVVSWAKGAGLTVTHLYPNHLVVDVSGSVSTVEKALQVQINTYRLGAKTFFANDDTPVLPSALAGVVRSVEGLSSLQTMFPDTPGLKEPAGRAYVPGPVVAAGPHAAANGSRAKLRAALANGRTATPNITDGGYDPTDLYSSEAYDYDALYGLDHCCNPLGNPGSSPAQTSIAIATFGSQNTSDMTGFHNQYPYLAYNFQEKNIDGTPSCCDSEGTMDLEWATAMANSFGASQNTAKVYLYDGANFNDATFTDLYNQMVSDNAARVFSTSWSCTEPPYGCSSSEISTRDAIFSEMAGQGWTLTAAQGDRGAYDNCSNLSVSFPGSDPNVVSAGGTELGLSPGPVYNSEVGWSGGPDGCSSNDGGTGGGCSAVFAAPSYQSNQPCGSGSRAVPDISLNADWFHTPQNYYFNGSLSGNGGTSIVAPELAGFFSQEDSYLLAEGSICGSGTSACAPMGNANFPLYEIGIDGAPHNPFYDITSGCNSNDVGVGYCAGPGYDLVTGWGSANMLQLAWAFNWHLLADDGRPVVTFSGPTPNTWYRTDQTVGISVADTGGGGGIPASGVAGFSDAWNRDPGDPTSEATPGEDNSFYDGPEFVNTSSGTLDLAAEGQGCHTVDVEAWDNMGFQSGDQTDGPLCYDTSAPHGTIKIDGGAVATKSASLTLALSATNPTTGDPVTGMAFSVDGGAYGAFKAYSTSATVSVPAGEGTRTVAVKYRNGAGTVGAPVSAGIFLVQTAPTVTGVSPRAGATAGGNTVTITGAHFAPGSTVKFGSSSAGTVTFMSSVKLTAVAPAGAAGTVHVSVTTPAGTNAATNGDLYAYGAPTLASISPTGGPAAGGTTVTILGTGYAPGSTVKFGTTPSATVTFVSSTKLTAVAPAHAAGTVQVTVTTPGGSSAPINAGLYAFGPATITSVTPPSGPAAGGTTVTIAGAGFVPGATVKFGTTSSATVTYVSTTKLTAVAPAHAAGTVDVSVTTAAGTSSAGSGDRYAYQPPPCVVPKVKGAKLKAAKSEIRAADCSVGKIKDVYSKTAKKGRVVSQKPKPGKTLKHGAKVDLAVSKGKHA